MIPFIDLLMVTISFLLITAVWTHMSRVNTTAQVPGKPDGEQRKVEVERVLHVEMREPDKFMLTWREGTETMTAIAVPRTGTVQEERGHKLVRYPELAKQIAEEWRLSGSHRAASDPSLDRAVLHTDNATPYVELVAAMDAIHEAHRAFTNPSTGKTENVPAFDVTFAAN